MTDPNEVSRREFLKGKSAQDTVGEEKDVSGLAAEQNKGCAGMQRQASYLEQYSKNAMACEFEIFFNLHQYTQSGGAAAAAFQLIDAIEDQMTVYRPLSEVSQINGLKKDESAPVENNLFGILSLALEIFRETDGAFDITSGPLTKVWQFDQRAGSIPTQREIEAALRRVGSQSIKLDPDEFNIWFLQDDIEINLGGIGKGHALDRVAQSFRDSRIEDFVIHGGQSSVLAGGNSIQMTTRNEESPGVGWKIGISHPTLPGVRLAEVALRNQALGTSGTGRQGFYHQGKRYGHIIDPRTGWPTAHVLSTTAIAESAARADALATAFFVMSVAEVATYCENHPDVGAILVVPEGSRGQVRVKTFNLPDQNIDVGTAAS